VFGYIPDIEAPPPTEPMDFAAWFRCYLDGRWHTFDARTTRARAASSSGAAGRRRCRAHHLVRPLTLTGSGARRELRAGRAG
jgi:transglutaminase-like putative cysteine protease